MELTLEDKRIMNSILQTLIYNNKDDFIKKLVKYKEKLGLDKYNLLIYGNQDLDLNNKNISNGDKYRTISYLDDMWCLQTQLFYHLNRTGKINQLDYDTILNI